MFAESVADARTPCARGERVARSRSLPGAPIAPVGVAPPSRSVNEGFLTPAYEHPGVQNG